KKTLEMLQVNLTVLTELTHSFASDMKKRRSGHILLTVSLLGYQAVPGYAAVESPRPDSFGKNMANRSTRYLRCSDCPIPERIICRPFSKLWSKLPNVCLPAASARGNFFASIRRARLEGSYRLSRSPGRGYTACSSITKPIV